MWQHCNREYYRRNRFVSQIYSKGIDGGFEALASDLGGVIERCVEDTPSSRTLSNILHCQRCMEQLVTATASTIFVQNKSQAKTNCVSKSMVLERRQKWEQGVYAIRGQRGQPRVLAHPSRRRLSFFFSSSSHSVGSNRLLWMVIGTKEILEKSVQSSQVCHRHQESQIERDKTESIYWE